MKKYEFSVNGIPVEINSFLDESHLEKEDLVNSILEQTEMNKRIGWGGFIKESYFENFLKRRVKIDDEMRGKEIKISDEDHVEEVKKALEKCGQFLEEKLYVFTIPKFGKFTAEKMGGAGGVNTFENVFFIEIAPYEDKEKQKESISHTVAHELGHALSKEHRIFNIFRMLKEEGLNEHFRESMVGGERAPWTQAISRERAMEIFEELKEKGKLEETSLDFYMELFFGINDKYPMWSGYTIGYYLMEDYLKSLETVDWKRLFKTPSEEILKTFK